MIVDDLIKLMEKLKTYRFTDELGHPLENCIEYLFMMQYTLESTKHLLTIMDDEDASISGFGDREEALEKVDEYIAKLKMLGELKK